ncbi:GIY-YIG nuclease family protein [Oceanicaulis alexandrii]|uniref:GIY-YIG nuclease family protein n=1 Tax=Oceanicaulis alexandrii TaxID=153233 RepID=UPI0023547001|nr:hypothetical protein [Oceanicaulis alexandrii]
MEPYKFAGHCFQALPAIQLLKGIEAVPNRAGVYLIAVPQSSPLLEGCPDSTNQFEILDAKYVVIYVGETYALKNRVLAHLSGDSKDSNFRHSIMSLHSSQSLSARYPLTEESLTQQLAENSVVGFCEPEYIGLVEQQLIQELQPVFNIRGCMNPDWVTSLKKMRKIFSASLKVA